MKHISRRKLVYTGYRVEGKRRTGAIKPARRDLPLAPLARKREPEPVVNYPGVNDYRKVWG